MRSIAASKGFVILVDDEDFERLSRHSWIASFSTRTGYRPCRTFRQKGRRFRVEAAHEILPKAVGLMVDHVNGDPFDNRRCNLRYATAGQNARNRAKPRGRWKNRFKGVYLHCSGKFQARIMFEGRSYALGVYDDELSAARAYDTAAIRFHGDFARLNLPNMVNSPASPETLARSARSAATGARFPLDR